MFAEQWVIGISIFIIAIAFACLVVFLIRTLFSTSQLIRNADLLVDDIKRKMHSFDPLLGVVDSVGQKMKRRCCCDACKPLNSCSCPSCQKCECGDASCELCSKEKCQKTGCSGSNCNCLCTSCCSSCSCEKKKSNCRCCGSEEKIENVTRSAIDFAEWALLGISIWQKIKHRTR